MKCKRITWFVSVLIRLFSIYSQNFRKRSQFFCILHFSRWTEQLVTWFFHFWNFWNFVDKLFRRSHDHTHDQITWLWEYTFLLFQTTTTPNASVLFADWAIFYLLSTGVYWSSWKSPEYCLITNMTWMLTIWLLVGCFASFGRQNMFCEISSGIDWLL
jgi:hypothetical protein